MAQRDAFHAGRGARLPLLTMSGLAVRTTARRTREHGDDGTRSALAAAEIANFGVPKEKITKKVFDVDGTAKTLCLVRRRARLPVPVDLPFASCRRPRSPCATLRLTLDRMPFCRYDVRASAVFLSLDLSTHCQR